MSPAEVIEIIRHGFRHGTYPGDRWLQGSSEGCEPAEECGAFTGLSDWEAIEPGFLDTHYTAPSFFSEAAFRFFMPAFLVADVRDTLMTADPTFHLAHGFSDGRLEEQVAGRRVIHRWGRSKLVNPRRYGAISWEDYARHRLAVFPREEAQAIVAFLEWKRGRESTRDIGEVPTIDAALDLFWRQRARSAPTAQDLAGQLAEEQELMRAYAERAGREHPAEGDPGS